MGCTQSKIEDEEAVNRCKERKRFMKTAVASRSGFAAHHSAYSIALKNTGAALSDFGHGEVHPDHYQSSLPPVADPLFPPPPPLPLPNYSPAPLLRAVSMPEFVIPKLESAKPADPIQEEDEEEEIGTPVHELTRRGRRGRSRGGDERIAEEVVPVVVPPLPPSPPRPPPTNTVPPPPPPPETTRESTWDYFFRAEDHTMAEPSISETDVEYVDDNKRRYDEKLKRTEYVDIASTSTSATTTSTSSNNSGVSKVETRVPEVVIEPEVVKPVKKVKQAVPTQQVIVETKIVSSVSGAHVSLTQILNELDDKFLKAYQSASEVSKLLEANRMHYHSNFADNQGHIDHSARLMRVITWNRSIKGLQNSNDVIDEDYDKHESLASVLDKLLAWEKKLYDEVKQSEHMKIEYQRKVASLNRRQNQGSQSESLEKAKAVVSHLHTRYIVDMQSMDSTVSEIAHLRDDHLYPKLVSLVDGMGRMWETMNAQHKAQMKISEDLKSLNVQDTPNETTEDHHKRTVQLYGAADDWHRHFGKLMMNQRNYVTNLNSWLKLNLIPLESNIKERVSSPPRLYRPPIHAFLHVWSDGLDRLPNELAGSAISSFAAIMDNIRILQEEEATLKMKCEKTNKELMRETREFDDWYRKYMERVDMDPTRGDDNKKDPLGERQMRIEILKQRLEAEEDSYRKHCMHVREKSLATLKNHLPELFGAMSKFSDAAMSMYKKLVPLAQPSRQSESL
ncbi:hypothetical protein ACHQM5_029516 [Ranunculus cassubicifolius]